MKLRRPERGEKYSNNKALFSFQAHTRTKPNGVSVDVVSLNLFINRVHQQRPSALKTGRKRKG